MSDEEGDYNDPVFTDGVEEAREIEWHSNMNALRDEMRKSKKQKGNAKVSNRRYNKMKILEKEGFFTLEAMKERDPLLYYQYIGCHSHSHEVKEKGKGKVGDEIADEIMERMQKLKSREIGAGCCSDSDGHRAEAEKGDACMDVHEEQAAAGEGGFDPNKYNFWAKDILAKHDVNEWEARLEAQTSDEMSAVGSAGPVRVMQIHSSSDLAFLEAEFRKVMMEKFLNGNESESIDYSEFDNDDGDGLDESVDDLMRNDAEDRYFE